MRRAQVKHNFIVIGPQLQTQIFIVVGVQAAPLLFMSMEACAGLSVKPLGALLPKRTFGTHGFSPVSLHTCIGKWWR